MAATNVGVGMKDVSFDGIAIVGVKNIKTDPEGTEQTVFVDDDEFGSLTHVSDKTEAIVMEVVNIHQVLQDFTLGQEGILLYTMTGVLGATPDSDVVINNTVLVGISDNNQHGGPNDNSGTLTFRAYAPDGATRPLSVTAAA